MPCVCSQVHESTLAVQDSTTKTLGKDSNALIWPRGLPDDVTEDELDSYRNERLLRLGMHFPGVSSLPLKDSRQVTMPLTWTTLTLAQILLEVKVNLRMMEVTADGTLKYLPMLLCHLTYPKARLWRNRSSAISTAIS